MATESTIGGGAPGPLPFSVANALAQFGAWNGGSASATVLDAYGPQLPTATDASSNKFGGLLGQALRQQTAAVDGGFAYSKGQAGSADGMPVAALPWFVGLIAASRDTTVSFGVGLACNDGVDAQALIQTATDPATRHIGFVFHTSRSDTVIQQVHSATDGGAASQIRTATTVAIADVVEGVGGLLCGMWYESASKVQARVWSPLDNSELYSAEITTDIPTSGSLVPIGGLYVRGSTTAGNTYFYFHKHGVNPAGTA